jgi:hypothetical protein
MPPATLGGTTRGRAALQVAIAELNAGAREIGGNNRGPFVKKYLHGLAEGNPWCCAFVSYCFSQHPDGPPFRYEVGAGKLRNYFRTQGWAYDLSSGTIPEPGDLVFWWRGASANSAEGHVGFVHQVRDGFLYTIEGNKSPRVQGFSYVLSRIDKLLGFGQVPEI